MPDSVIIYRESLQPFSLACGNRQALALAVAGRDDRSSIDLHSFDKPFVRIGRGLHNDLVLPDRAVSFRHMYLQMLDGNWIYFDLHSTVRSEGGRRRSPTWGWLDESQELTVGPYQVCARPSEASGQRSDLPRREHAMPEAVTEFELELVNRQNYPTRRIRRAVTIIGSSRHCDLWLNDPSVSSVHASLVLTSRGVWVVDLLGRNGISVNRRRVSWKQLQNGSFLEVGRFCFRVWINDAKPLTLDRSAGTVARPEPTEPQLNSEELAGSLTRDFVMGVLNHLVQSRTEFFEHLRQQSQLIQQLFAELNEARATPVLGDLQRIEKLDQELADIKQQLKRLTEAYESTAQPPDASMTADDQELLPAANDNLPVEAVDLSAANGLEESFASSPPQENPNPVESVELDRSGQTEPNVVDRTSSPTGPAISVQEAHALLSQRMSRLAHERNSLIQSLLRHLRLA